MATTTTSTPFPTSDTSGMSSMETTPASTAVPSDPTQRVAQGAHEAVDRLAQKAAPVVEKIKTQWTDAATSLQSRADDLSVMQKEWSDSARTHVRDNPLQSVGIALAVGWLIGRLTAN